MKGEYQKILHDKRVQIGIKAGAILLSCVMLVGGFMNGTLAWFTAKTEPVVNIFTVGDIDLKLEETGASKAEKEEVFKKSYHFVPGEELQKDPSVTVKVGSEKCYVFIRVQEADNTHKDLKGSIINWKVDETVWKPVIGADTKQIPGYWYRIVEVNDTDPATKDEQGVKLYILKNNKVTVNEEVTKEMVDAINAKNPTLSFKAAAVQFAGMNNVLEAWNNLPEDFKN